MCAAEDSKRSVQVAALQLGDFSCVEFSEKEQLVFRIQNKLVEIMNDLDQLILRDEDGKNQD